MIFNAMVEAMLFLKLLLGILIDIGHIIATGIKALFNVLTLLICKLKEGNDNKSVRKGEVY